MVLKNINSYGFDDVRIPTEGKRVASFGNLLCRSSSSDRLFMLARDCEMRPEARKSSFRLHSADRRTTDFLQVAPIETASP